MSTINISSNRSLQRVSKRHVVADLVDRIQEEQQMEQEREEFKTLKEIAEYCDLKLSQKIDSNGNDEYVLLKQDEVRAAKHMIEADVWMPDKVFKDINEAKTYLISLKKRVDEFYDNKANQTEREVM